MQAKESVSEVLQVAFLNDQSYSEIHLVVAKGSRMYTMRILCVQNQPDRVLMIVVSDDEEILPNRVYHW